MTHIQFGVGHNTFKKLRFYFITKHIMSRSGYSKTTWFRKITELYVL